MIDRGDGSYAINFSATVPGDYRMQARLENVELPTVNLQVREPTIAEIKAEIAPPAAVTALIQDAAAAATAKIWKQQAEGAAEGLQRRQSKEKVSPLESVQQEHVP